MKHRARRRREIPASLITLARLSCALLGVFLVTLAASAQTLSEYDVEAAYLYNFGKFVRWPSGIGNESSTFDICILGHDPFGGILDKLIAGDKIDGKPIRKRIVNRPAEAESCAIVYISDSESADLRSILSGLSGRGELLVSSLPNFLREGGMIQFVLEGDRVRFQVNLDPATNSHLVFSSQLLKVAMSVVGKPQNSVVR